MKIKYKWCRKKHKKTEGCGESRLPLEFLYQSYAYSAGSRTIVR